eukprot:scaffold186275_cov36-Prasinocladus_malaysianus.AAC.2
MGPFRGGRVGGGRLRRPRRRFLLGREGQGGRGPVQRGPASGAGDRLGAAARRDGGPQGGRAGCQGRRGGRGGRRGRLGPGPALQEGGGGDLSEMRQDALRPGVCGLLDDSVASLGTLSSLQKRV